MTALDPKLARELSALAEALRTVRATVNRKRLYADWPPSCVPHCSVVLCDGLNTVLALQELAAPLGEARP